jgi:hypothetical protein
MLKEHRPYLNSTETLQTQDSSTSHIEDCEQAFIEGHFREALHLANQYLFEQKSRSQSLKDDIDSQMPMLMSSSPSTPLSPAASLPLPPLPPNSPSLGRVMRQLSSSSQPPVVYTFSTPLYFTFDRERQPRTFSVRWSSSGSTSPHDDHDTWSMDRAAAVALQSWYEIYQRTGSLRDRLKGGIHLQAFLNTYAATPHRLQKTVKPITTTTSAYGSLSLPLLVVFIQFCVAMDHRKEALILSAELLQCFIHHSNDTSMENSVRVLQDEGREIVLLLFTQLLPYTSNPSNISELFRRVTQNQDLPILLSQWKLTQPPQMKLESVQELLVFLDDTSITINATTLWDSWPFWLRDIFPECQQRLEHWMRTNTTSTEETSWTELDDSTKPTEDVASLEGPFDATEKLPPMPQALVSLRRGLHIPMEWDVWMRSLTQQWDHARDFLHKKPTLDEWKEVFTSWKQVATNHLQTHGIEWKHRLISHYNKALTLTSEDWKLLMAQWWHQVQMLLQKALVKYLHSHGTPEEQVEQLAKVSIGPLLAYLGWRRRRLIFATTKNALLLLAIKPLMEIVQALVPNAA